MNMKLVFLLTISFIHSITCWTLKTTYNSTNFVDQFRFFSKNDPSRGLALYQNETNAVSKGLIQMNNQSVLIKPNNKTVSSEGRESVRIHSKESYNHGLFIIDLNHIPTGCGVWPAFWLTGKSWGQNSEIDIIEGVNKAKKNTISIHSRSGCTTSNVTQDLSSPSFTCSETKCTSRFNDTKSFGEDFNKNKGGVYALQWIRETSLQFWFFSRDSMPADITSGNLTQWPAPTIYYRYGTSNPTAFSNLSISLGLAFCGSWTGNPASYAGCPESCESFVKNTPSAFNEAYWDINYIKVYQ